MTSLATLIGLIPMALKLGTGSEAYAPLARAIIGGLAVSVVLTVFIVPAAYLLVYRRREAAAVSSRRHTPRSPTESAWQVLAMPRFAIRYPYLIIVLCLITCVVGVTSLVRMPVDLFPADPHSRGGGGHVLFRDAARADRERHHRTVRAVLHPGQRHRPHRVALAARREPDQGLLPAGHGSGLGRDDDRQSRAGEPAPAAARDAAAGGAEIRRVEPAGVPDHAERRRA